MNFKIKDPSDVIVEKTAGWLFSEPSKSAIYGILNLINGKIYIGSAVNKHNRLNDHKSKLNLNKHPSKHLQGSYNKYGFFAFEFLVLEYCDKEALLEREKYWIILTDATNPNYGYNKRKIPNSNLGLKLGPASDARKKRMSEIHTGRIVSQNQRISISEKLKGRKLTAQHIANVIAATKGKHASDQRKAKIGLANSRLDLWPHGYKCNCRECLDKKNLARRLNRYNHNGEFSLD